MTTTTRTRRAAKIGSAAGGLGLAVVAVLGFSNAAFSAEASPVDENNWATDGAISLDLNEQQTAPLFSFGLGGTPGAPRRRRGPRLPRQLPDRRSD